VDTDALRTLADLPFFAAGRYPRAEFIGRASRQGIAWTSGREMLERVRDLSLGFTALGMARGDRVAIVSESRPEWLFADLAVLAAGGVTTPLYPTLTAPQIGALLADSGASLAVVSSSALLDRVISIADQAPALRAIVVIDLPETLPASRLPIVSLAEVSARGHRRILDGWGVAREFQDGANRVQPDDPATLIYTSGTTGEPKGVVLTHGNLVGNLESLHEVLDLTDEDLALSFLPLSHAFERIVAYVYLRHGVSVVFAESVDTIDRDLRLVKPTVMTGVPRVFEKMEGRVLAAGRQLSAPRRMVLDWALGVARRRGRILPDGGRLSWWGRLESALAERLVFGEIRARLGGRLRYAVSGGAPLPVELGQLFFGLGLPILEGYGLTETSPVLSLMPLARVKLGTVGRPLPRVDIDIAEDGEILARGPNVMQGYYQRPQETAEAIRGGWFHTGDLGAIDADGYLRITGRKKALIVTSGGKKVASQPIEEALKAHAIIAEAMVVGDGRHFPAVLIVPAFGELARRLSAAEPGDEAAARELIERKDALELYERVIATLNPGLAQFERIKRFALLPREFTVERGELTPTLKVKRRVVEERYRAVIEQMYESSA
jgi:long-chain acyl-CoA synthetase